MESRSAAIADRPEILRWSMACWDKVVRRDFFRSLDIGFAPKWPHEDVALSAHLLLEASKLSVLDQVCYRYRRNNPGSAMRDQERRRHFRAFDAWRAVLDWAQIRVKVDDPQVTAEVYRTLFERAIHHYTTLLDTRGFVATDDRREFFEQMTADFIKYAPPDYQLPGGLRGRKFGLIRDGDYRKYAALDPLNKARNGLKIAGQMITPRV